MISYRSWYPHTTRNVSINSASYWFWNMHTIIKNLMAYFLNRSHKTKTKIKLHINHDIYWLLLVNLLQNTRCLHNHLLILLLISSCNTTHYILLDFITIKKFTLPMIYHFCNCRYTTQLYAIHVCTILPSIYELQISQSSL